MLNIFIKIYLFLIILYIVINEYIDSNNKNINIEQKKESKHIKKNPIIHEPDVLINQPTRLIHDIDESPKEESIDEPENNIQEFDRPYPWTKIIYMNGNEFPYLYHIKIVIPSLNDFERWKQIIPNLDFNPKSKELIIPSKDEASALAIANLISINFSGQMTMKDILDKNLITISIIKAKTHELVRNKLREQIMEILFGKSFNTIQTNYEQDLANNGIESTNNSIITEPIENKSVSLTSEKFRDTFQHFSNDINTYDNSSYSFI